jgi:NADPH:quinone reductase-like Zn-dependent oxidoreductase
MSLPTHMKAYVTEGAKGLIREVPLPKHRPTEVLVKTLTVAINPIDWKNVDNKWGKEGNIIGTDVAGEVVAVGSEVTEFKVGDQLFAFVPGSSYYRPDNGPFAEYCAVEARKAFRVPTKLAHDKRESIPIGPVDSLEAASSFPCTLTTVSTGLEYYAKIPLEHNPKYANQYFFVWGGASSLGQSVIQLARLVGFKVIATASRSNWETLAEIGVEKCFDYHDKDVLDQIKKYAGDNITLAYDTVAGATTSIDTYEVMSKTRPSQMLIALPFDQTAVRQKNDLVHIEFPLGYLAVEKVRIFGKEQSDPALFEAAAGTVKRLNRIFAEKPNAIRHMPIRVLANGFDSLDEALDLARTGKISGKKLVVRMA